MLDRQTLALTQEVRSLLGEGLEALSRTSTNPTPLRQALLDLEGPFLLVVVGEFNSGKSSLLNALLATNMLKEGVTPTTDRIHLIGYGPANHLEPLGPDLSQVFLPLETLKDLRLVDTPGTNAIQTHHQTLTERFLPRADLILFVTSADRPFTQTEASFLSLIKEWGKKVVLVVNKVDLLSPAEQTEVLAFVRGGAAVTLGQEVPVFGVSARQAKQGSNGGVQALQQHINQVLAGQAAQLKLGSPLGVLLRLIGQTQPQLSAELEQNRLQLSTCNELEALLQRHQERTQRDFAGQVALAAQVLDEVRERGEVWLDQTVRLNRFIDLLSANRLQSSFMREVAQDSNAALERSVQQSLTWLAKRNQELLEDAVVLLREAPTLMPARPTHPETVEQAIQKALASYKPEQEALYLQDHIQNALQSTVLAGLGGVGLGAGLVLILQTLAADITGMVAGLVAAILGLSILPRRKDQAKSRLRQRLAEVRTSLEAALNQAHQTESARTAERFQALYRPACASLDAARLRLSQEQQHLQTLQSQAQRLLAKLG